MGKDKKASLKVLQKKSTRLIRQEYMDYDYVDQLSEEEKQWLADFTDEYYNASVGRQKDEGEENRFHKSKELVKERQTANNKRNNDVYGKKKATNDLVSLKNLGLQNDDPNFAGYRNTDPEATEDAMIGLLDYKRKNFGNSSTDSDEDTD